MPRLFVLDDVEGRHVAIAGRYPAWERVHVYGYADAVAALDAHDVFDLALLDHDLGEDPRTGYDVALAIIAMPSDRRPREAIVHSHNPNGAERMRDLLRSAGIKCDWIPFSGLRA